LEKKENGVLPKTRKQAENLGENSASLTLAPKDKRTNLYLEISKFLIMPIELNTKMVRK